EQADPFAVPLDRQPSADQSRWRGVVGALDLDVSVETHRPLAVLVVAKWLDWKRQQMRPLFLKHRGDLTLRRAVDPLVSPVRVPAIEVRLRLLDRFEAHPLQRRPLRVPDGRFRLPHVGAVLASIGARVVIDEPELTLLDAGVNEDAARLEDARADDLSSHPQDGVGRRGHCGRAEGASGARVLGGATWTGSELKAIEEHRGKGTAVVLLEDPVKIVKQLVRK